MTARYRLLVGLLAFLPAFADVTVTVYPSLAPNIYGSPSWSGYLQNAMTALETGASSIGDPATDPTAYYQVTQITPNQNVVADFPLWLGNANPTGAFANELGNRLHFGVVITGGLFSLSELSFEMSSSDPNDLFEFADDFATDDYSLTRIGYINNVGFVTSGPGTQLVNALYYVGVGNAPDVYSSDPGTTNQDKVDNLLAGAPLYDCNGTPCGIPLPPYEITTTYTLTDSQGDVIGEGSGTVDVIPSAVPDPGSIVLLGTMIAGAGFFRFRRASAKTGAH